MFPELERGAPQNQNEVFPGAGMRCSQSWNKMLPELEQRAPRSWNRVLPRAGTRCSLELERSAPWSWPQNRFHISHHPWVEAGAGGQL